MNIFILDNEPGIAARMMCDKHIPKMCVETLQMMGSALRRHGATDEQMPLTQKGTPLKGGYHNHPCTIWTRENTANYNWHYKHFIALCDEYTHRYKKVHATDTKLRQALKTPPTNMSRSNKRTPFKLAMKSNPECMFEDAVKSYRAFYHTKQKRFSMTWSNRDIPEWWNATEVA